MSSHQTRFLFATLVCLVAAAPGFCSNIIATSSSGLIEIDGNNGDNSVEVFFNTKSIVVRGYAGTTINGQSAQYFSPTGIAAIHINLKSGRDTFYVHDLQIEELLLEHEFRSGEAFVSNCKITNFGAIMGAGDDSVQVEDCEGDFLFVGDSPTGFLMPTSLDPTLSKSRVHLNQCRFRCADLQAELVSVDGFLGAIRAMATKATIFNVDTTWGDVGLYCPICTGVSPEPSSVWLTADRDSAKTDFTLWNVFTRNIEVATTGTLFNRTSEDDFLRLFAVQSETLYVTTGKGTDYAMLVQCDLADQSVIDLGASRDGNNYGYFSDVDCDRDLEVFGGDQVDQFHFQGGLFKRDLVVDTDNGSDVVKLNSVEIGDYLDVSLGDGNDSVKLCGVKLGHETTVDGGRGVDDAEMDAATVTYEVETISVESHNLMPFFNN
ncbi:hypothetical protein [Mariniblastus fucicola]|uniref:Uncharacterized protein n=1 Tax=Mariniblastus fucicola TaxID=980251 RepID=A0A5B9PGN4_9BACT|nr:hypothetical protein [Mariniblastus fucicola]QEG23922.1 hypothetical protein MFFC18_38270 [Mariniblastus fucicola]